MNEQQEVQQVDEGIILDGTQVPEFNQSFEFFFDLVDATVSRNKFLPHKHKNLQPEYKIAASLLILDYEIIDLLKMIYLAHCEIVQAQMAADQIDEDVIDHVDATNPANRYSEVLGWLQEKSLTQQSVTVFNVRQIAKMAKEFKLKADIFRVKKLCRDCAEYEWFVEQDSGYCLNPLLIDYAICHRPVAFAAEHYQVEDYD